MERDIISAIADLKSSLDIQVATSNQQDKKVDEMYKVLVVGNGVPSIKERVSRLEEHMPDRDDWLDIKRWVERERKWRTVLMATVITQTVVLVFQVLRSMIMLP